MNWIEYKTPSGAIQKCDENVWAMIQKSPNAKIYEFVQRIEPNQASIGIAQKTQGNTNKPTAKKSGCGCGK